MAKLLVNKSKTKIMPNGSSLLKHLLEVQNETNMSALLVASKLRDPALIELLVEAGTNCEALDEESNSALLLAASSLAEDRAPTKELCPSIFEVISFILLFFCDIYHSILICKLYFSRFTKDLATIQT